jgi:uncharacterized membrane protein YhaH (DUF805 family)
VQSFQSPRSRSPVFWLLFGLKGRISRGVYWLAYLLIIAVQSVILAQIISGGAGSFYDVASSLGPIVLIVTLYSNLAIAVKRLHDVGYAGFLALALLVPVVNLAFTIWVGVLPGTPDPNRFGDAPDIPPA